MARVACCDFSENATTIASQREIHWNHAQATFFTAHYVDQSQLCCFSMEDTNQHYMRIQCTSTEPLQKPASPLNTNAKTNWQFHLVIHQQDLDHQMALGHELLITPFCHAWVQIVHRL